MVILKVYLIGVAFVFIYSLACSLLAIADKYRDRSISVLKIIKWKKLLAFSLTSWAGLIAVVTYVLLK